MQEQLSLATLSRLHGIACPRYDVAALSPGIVHIGCGAFHRAHQAVYTEQALAAAYGSWGIIGASLRQQSASNLLRRQNGLYAVLTKSQTETSAMIIGCMRDVIHTPSDPALLPRIISAPEIRVVSLTVTEKGYCLKPSDGTLDFAHPDISHDLRLPSAPVSAIGTLFAGLHARRLAHGRPLSVLCCDNLQHNGQLLRRLTLSFADAVDTDTARWIADTITFPDTMVDRIVPATTASTLAEVSDLLGLEDRAAVWAEPFKQWVIHDNFAAKRPLWEAAGAQLVSDVTPYENMKLRLLNSSNSLLAYLGYLGGDEYIDQAIHAPGYADLTRRFMIEEAAPTLTMPPNQDLGAYQAQLLERFANSALPHRCHQIAMDGSQKLPQRLLCIVRDNLVVGRSIRISALIVAAWMRYVAGVDEAGKPIAVQDPMADQLRVAAQGDAASVVNRLLALRSIFGEDLPRSEMFRQELVKALACLQREGSRRTVAAYVEGRT